MPARNGPEYPAGTDTAEREDNWRCTFRGDDVIAAPTPDPAFRWTTEPWGQALRCRPLETAAQHLFTTRQLELRASNRSEEAWTLAAASVGGQLEQVMRLRQVHGRRVRVLGKGAVEAAESTARPEADAMVSDAPGLVLAVQVADCVPILMSNRAGSVVAAVHAGWRGTAAGIVREAIRTMRETFGSPAGDLIVALGPSIAPCCYEVGPELLDAFREQGASDGQLQRWFNRTAVGSLRLDVAAANIEQISEAGVPREQIFHVGLCTKTHEDWFDSYRAAGPQVGRMAGLIRVRP